MEHWLFLNLFTIILVATGFSLAEYDLKQALVLRHASLHQENKKVLLSRGSPQPGPSSKHVPDGAESKDIFISIPPFHRPQQPYSPHGSSHSSFSLPDYLIPSPDSSFTSVPQDPSGSKKYPEPVSQHGFQGVQMDPQGQARRLWSPPPVRSIDREHSLSSGTAIAQAGTPRTDKTTCEKLKDACKKAGGMVVKNPTALGLSTAAVGSTIIAASIGNENPVLATGVGLLCGGLVCTAGAQWAKAFQNASSLQRLEGHRPHKRDLDDLFSVLFNERSLKLDKRGTV